MNILRIVSFILLLPFAVAAQDQRSLINVTGHAEKQVTPDMTNVFIEIHSKHQQLSEAMSDVGKRKQVLINKLQKMGFTKDEMKMQNIQAGKNVIWRDGENVDDGFYARQVIILEFPYKQERITKVMSSFTGDDAGTGINFNFYISDTLRKQLREQLLSEAIKDAKAKAEIIAKSAGISLGKIAIINHTDSFRPMPMYKEASVAMQRDGAESAGNLEINDISVSEEISMSWEIGS